MAAAEQDIQSPPVLGSDMWQVVIHGGQTFVVAHVLDVAEILATHRYAIDGTYVTISRVPRE